MNFSKLMSKRTSLVFFLIGLMWAPLSLAITTVDVLVLYTPGLTSRYDGAPETRINHLFSVTNQSYLSSGLDIQIRLVHSEQVAYPDDGDSGDALRAITLQTHSAFTNVPALRTQYGADMVLLYRPYMNGHNSCGIAWLGGYGASGNMQWSPGYMFAHVSATLCGDYVTGHELGHNMGLHHSRRQAPAGGTFPYAVGYGVDNVFVEMLAYQTSFNVDYYTGKEYKFSSPNLTCRGYPCGISSTDATNGADAVKALAYTVPQIATFYPTVISNGGGGSGGGSGGGGGDDESDEEKEARLAFEAAEKAMNEAGDTLAEAETTLEEAETAYEKIKEEIVKLDVSIDALRVKIEAAKATRDDLGDQYREALTKKKTDPTVDTETLRKKYEAAKTAYETLKEDKDALDEDKGSKKTEKRAAKTAKSDAKSDVRDAKSPFKTAVRVFKRAQKAYQKILDKKNSGSDESSGDESTSEEISELAE